MDKTTRIYTQTEGAPFDTIRLNTDINAAAVKQEPLSQHQSYFARTLQNNNKLIEHT